MGILNLQILRLLIVISIFITLGNFQKSILQISKCHQNDTVCINNEATKMFKSLHNGLEELGIPKMDPLILNDFEITNGAHGLSVNVSDAIVTGIKDTDLKDIKFDVSTQSMTLHLMHNIQLTGKHKTHGRILVFTIKGTGNFKTIITELDWEIKFKWNLITKNDNKKYIQLNNAGNKYKMQHAKFEFNGLLGDNIDSFMNVVLNQQWREVVADLGDPGLQILLNKYKSIIDSILSRMPYNELFL